MAVYGFEGFFGTTTGAGIFIPGMSCMFFLPASPGFICPIIDRITSAIKEGYAQIYMPATARSAVN